MINIFGRKYKEALRRTDREIDLLRSSISKIKKDNRTVADKNKRLTSQVSRLRKQMKFLTKRENKLQIIEMMFKSGSVDLDKLSDFILDKESE